MGMDQQFDKWRKYPAALQAAILRDSGEHLSVKELANFLADTSARVSNVAWFAFIVQHVEIAAKRLFHMGWSLLSPPPSSAFITNDVGIVKCAGRIDRPVRFMLGFAGGRSHWVFPISPEVAFAVLPTPGGVKGEAKPEWVETINKQAVDDAHRFVYSRSLFDPCWP